MRKVFKSIMHGLNVVYDFLFIILMILLLVFAFYAKWDSEQVYIKADPVQYLQYKPSPPEMVSFEELQEINPDVMGWLTVYGTNIDYPLVQSDDNNYYLNHSPKKQPEVSGSLYLDYRNDKQFKDFNTIIYGHHMAQHKMFGDLDKFLDEEFWNSHEYGNLIYDAQNHGLQFIAMLQVDAYDWVTYNPAVNGEENRIRYINHLYETAKYVRGIDTETLKNLQKQLKKDKDNGEPLLRTSPVTPDDHLVLLSTCSADITNGRFILVAKMLDHPVENPFPDEEHTIVEGIDTDKIVYYIGKWKLQTWIIFLLLLILLILMLYLLSRRRDRRKQGEKAHDEDE